MPSVLHPVWPRMTAEHSGRSMTCQTGLKKMNPMIIPAMRPSAILTTRLRSSRR